MIHEVRNVRFSHMLRKGNKPTHLLIEHALGIIDFFSLDGRESSFLGTSSSS